MKPATLDRPRAATLADLQPGDPIYVVTTLGRRITAKLGTVTERTVGGGFRVYPEPTNPVPGQNCASMHFDREGRYLGRMSCVTAAVELPEGARVVGSLAVAS